MPEDAKSILSELQSGQNIAQADVYPHSLAFSDHARLYFENAADLCDSGTADFAVFAAFYSMRHGLELWLKCFRRNAQIDKFLNLVFRSPKSNLEELAVQISLTESNLRAVICAMRNVLSGDYSHPECWQKRQETTWATKGLKLIRSNGDLPRQRFASLWNIGSYEHDLRQLWNDVRHEITNFFQIARSVPKPSLDGQLAPSRLSGIVEFFHYFDPNGEAFRYPTSHSGAWHTHLPDVSLEKLKELADELVSSTISYRSQRREIYELATLDAPRPTVSEAGPRS